MQTESAFQVLVLPSASITTVATKVLLPSKLFVGVMTWRDQAGFAAG
jgi:hypothetical protein